MASINHGVFDWFSEQGSYYHAWWLGLTRLTIPSGSSQGMSKFDNGYFTHAVNDILAKNERRLRAKPDYDVHIISAIKTDDACHWAG